MPELKIIETAVPPEPERNWKHPADGSTLVLGEPGRMTRAQVADWAAKFDNGDTARRAALPATGLSLSLVTLVCTWVLYAVLWL